MGSHQIGMEKRRTTRVLLRVPVVLIVEEDGRTSLIYGWTTDVNVHGAKIEIHSRLLPDQEVTIQVPYTGLSQKGKVVWNGPEPNLNGSFEIGVQLEKPENLWGVVFPPEDWIPVQAPAELASSFTPDNPENLPEPGKSTKGDAAQSPLPARIRSAWTGSEKEPRQPQPGGQPGMEQRIYINSLFMGQNPGDIMSAFHTALRSGLEQQLPSLMRELLEQCRIQGERMMAAQVEQWTLLFSDRVQAALQSLQERMDDKLQELVAGQETALATRVDELHEEAGAKLDQQLNRIGTQVRQAFLRHIVTELSRSQQVWLKQAEKQLEQMELESLERTRRKLAQYVQGVGEAALLQELASGEPQREHQTELPLETHVKDTLSDKS